MSPIVSTSAQDQHSGEGSGPAGPSKLAPGIYLVATPIGNPGDVTLRALDTLRRADVVACEDTRVTRRLLQRHGIETPLASYHEHNAPRMRPVLLDRVRAGEAVALASDAGTPLVSDPGYKLVREALDQGLSVVPVPGASAPMAALVVSGLPSDRFLFAGFLPNRSAARRSVAAELKSVPATLIFFESAQRLAESLADLADVLGGRDAAVARELTKRYEEVRRGTLPELAHHYAADGPPKGEIVVVVGPPGDREQETGDEAVQAMLKDALRRLSVRDAAAEVAAATGRPRRAVYALALALSRGSDAGSPPTETE